MNYNENKSRALMLQGKAVEKGIHFAMQYGDLVPFSTIHDYTAKYFDKHAKKLHKNIREARKRELYFLLKKGYSIISNISGEYKNGVSNFEVKIGNHIYKGVSDFDFKRKKKKVCIELKVSTKSVNFPSKRHIKQAIKYAIANDSVTTIVYLTKNKDRNAYNVSSKVFEIWEKKPNTKFSTKDTKLITCNM